MTHHVVGPCTPCCGDLPPYPPVDYCGCLVKGIKVVINGYGDCTETDPPGVDPNRTTINELSNLNNEYFLHPVYIGGVFQDYFELNLGVLGDCDHRGIEIADYLVVGSTPGPGNPHHQKGYIYCMQGSISCSGTAPNVTVSVSLTALGQLFQIQSGADVTCYPGLDDGGSASADGIELTSCNDPIDFSGKNWPTGPCTGDMPTITVYLIT